jgi:hypothetical protein
LISVYAFCIAAVVMLYFFRGRSLADSTHIC